MPVVKLDNKQQFAVAYSFSRRLGLPHQSGSKPIKVLVSRIDETTIGLYSDAGTIFQSQG